MTELDGKRGRRRAGHEARYEERQAASNETSLAATAKPGGGRQGSVDGVGRGLMEGASCFLLHAVSTLMRIRPVRAAGHFCGACSDP